MNLILLYAASLIATFITWYLCLIVPGPIPRGILRATIIAFLCSPGILIGHGFAITPSLFALYAQPSVFTFGSMLVIWIIALGVIFGVPALRNDRGEWPPSVANIFLNAHWIKFVFFGVVAAALLQATINTDAWRGLWIDVAKYGLFFANAVFNLAICYWAVRLKRANSLLTPLLFAAPALLVAAPTVALMWYGGGVIGGLTGGGRWRAAGWTSLAVFSLLFLNSTYRIYAAATAPAHVTIGGGVAGNATMAAIFAVLAIAPWLLFRRQHDTNRGEGQDRMQD